MISFTPLEDEEPKVKTGGISFTPLEGDAPKPTVKPGDVEGRKAQLAEASVGAKPNRVREELSIGGEFLGGLGDMASGAANIFKGLPELSVEGVLNDPRVKMVTGAARAVASPLAPVTNAVTDLGQGASDTLQKLGFTNAADVVGGLTTVAGDILAPGLIGKAAKVVKPAIKSAPGLQSNRSKAATVTSDAEAAIASAEAKAVAAKKAADDGIESARSSAEAARESYESIGEAAKRSIPGRADLERIGGPQLGQATGQRFQGHYETTRNTRKAGFDEAYDELLGPDAPGTSTADKMDDASDVAKSLQARMKEATDPAEKEAATKAFKEFIETGKAPESDNLRELHTRLLATRREHRAARRYQNDDVARMLGLSEEKIQAKMDKLQPGTSEALRGIDADYGKDYAPYFSKGALTRSIVDKDAAAVAKNAILPTSKSGKEVEIINRTLELIGDNTQLRRELGRSHLNGLVDEASKAPSFREGFVKQWERYTNRSGNNNHVLRAAYGEDYDSVNSLVNQFKNSKPKTIDALVNEMVKGAESTASSTVKSLEGSAKFAEKARAVEVATLKKKMEADVAQLMGKASSIGTRLESIGSGVFVSGTLGGSKTRALTGGVIAISAKALSTLIQTTRGRSALKAVARGTPGTAQAAANARIIESLTSVSDD